MKYWEQELLKTKDENKKQTEEMKELKWKHDIVCRNLESKEILVKELRNQLEKLKKSGKEKRP